MIRLNDCAITFHWAGLFMTEDDWIHPRICETTYELIYVTAGDVYIEEDGTDYHLSPGSLLLLKPGEHAGSHVSHGKTSFYWFHFHADAFSALSIASNVFSRFERSYLFKELLHHFCARDLTRCEITLLYILSELFRTDGHDVSPLAANVLAWVNANAGATLTAADVGAHFGYSSDHVSRVVRRAYSRSLKELITEATVSAANTYLANSAYSVKEIAALLKFPSANAFIHFYTYHEGISPSSYRKSYPLMKINKK